MNIYHIAPQRSGHIWVATMIQSWLPDAEILDLEGFDPMDFRKVQGKKIRGVIVLQTRDLLNWYASYIRGKTRFRIGAIPTWEAITDEYYTPKYLKGYKVIRVMYDDFVANPLYRREICKALKGKYNESKLEYVPGSGHGSSFNGLEYQGQGSMMETLTRYEQVEKGIYEELFRNRTFLKDFYVEHISDNVKQEFIKSLEL